MRDGKAATSRKFVLWVLAVALVGLVIRLIYAISHRHTKLGGDAIFYQLQAKALADGHGFIEGAFFYYQYGRIHPSAEHPPLFTMFLAVPELIGFNTVLQLRLWCVPLGVATVILIGYAARELAGDRAGIIAAILAAVYPYFWMTDGLVMSEALTTPTVALALLFGARLYRAPTLGWAAAFGVATGVATLVRAELVLLVPLVLLPLALRKTTGNAKFRFKVLVIGGVTTALVLSPWVIRNLTTFEHPVTISNGWDLAVIGANCPTTYYHENIGGIDLRCGKDLPDSDDQTVQFTEARRRGLEYASEHLDRIPLVVFARLGRTFGFFNVRQQAWYDAYFERRERPISYAGLLTYWAMIPFGIYGLVLLRRRRISLVPILAPVITVAIGVAVTFGNTRLRIPADVSLVIAAGIGISAVLARRSRENDATPTPRSSDRDPATTGLPHPA